MVPFIYFASSVNHASAQDTPCRITTPKMSMLLLATWHSAQLCFLAALTGAAAHALYFVRGRHDHYALVTAVAHAGAGTLLAAVAVAQRGLVAGLGLALVLSACYTGALFGSIAVYRLFLHPLARFPGPVAARLTKFYGPWIARNGRMHWEHSRLIAEYGPIVRIGEMNPASPFLPSCSMGTGQMKSTVVLMPIDQPRTNLSSHR